MRLSVIIPCWNDTGALGTTLDRFHELKETAAATGDVLEIIVAEATSTPNSAAWGTARGADHVITCPEPSRGRQMNLGAAAATGEALLFQHVDTDFTAEHLSALLAAFRRDPELVGGAFHRQFDARHPGLRWLEPIARWWVSRGAGLFYGDQSIFIRRTAFARLGGFTDIPLMEDLDFARRLRRAFPRGSVRLLDPPIATSARRHLERGAWRTSLENGLFIVLYRLSVSPHRLHGWYYRGRLPRPGVHPSPSHANLAP